MISTGFNLPRSKATRKGSVDYSILPPLLATQFWREAIKTESTRVVD